ncbi:hypothetical protein PIB30_029481 [Stylosanthes scabra]|uniref:Uncharacterized protein n=1 Tax=Stylosanthes scabra TaxID=79078 RepID=A0ABU6RC18_9FABA|nr:hypothetical protein [Stylosanthes scabra]
MAQLGQRAHVICELSHVVRKPKRPRSKLRQWPHVIRGVLASYARNWHKEAEFGREDAIRGSQRSLPVHSFIGLSNPNRSVSGNNLITAPPLDGAASGLDRSTPCRRNPHRNPYLQTDVANDSISLELQPGTEHNIPAATTPFNLVRSFDDSVHHCFRPYPDEQDDEHDNIISGESASQVPKMNDLFAGVVDNSSQHSVGEGRR